MWHFTCQPLCPSNFHRSSLPLLFFLFKVQWNVLCLNIFFYFSRNYCVLCEPWCAGGILDKAESMVGEFQETMSKNPPSLMNCLVNGLLPLEVLFKVNFDAAIFDDIACVCVGLEVVIRDHKGTFLFSN